MDHRGNTAPTGLVVLVMLTVLLSGAVVVNAVQIVDQEADQRREDVERALSTATPQESPDETAVCKGGEKDSEEGQGHRCETATS